LKNVNENMRAGGEGARQRRGEKEKGERGEEKGERRGERSGREARYQ
jgi:hypothetical protein